MRHRTSAVSISDYPPHPLHNREKREPPSSFGSIIFFLSRPLASPPFPISLIVILFFAATASDFRSSTETQVGRWFEAIWKRLGWVCERRRGRWIVGSALRCGGVWGARHFNGCKVEVFGFGS
ncbi:hypothetical protein L484_024131 [Morus notabilis]|uniref:Uncharacterized protein n=1 Tax=Morus notabilis TaxID=981085 RepID=W9RXL3_9ROSA|nr:hypothetical protein L484_024131 [Morus notabilis]